MALCPPPGSALGHTQKSSEGSHLCAGCDKKETRCTRASRQTHSTFRKSMMVSMGVFKLGQVDMIFIDARVKINGSYYREVLLTRKLLPVMREICGEFFIFLQGNAAAILTPVLPMSFCISCLCFVKCSMISSILVFYILRGSAAQHI